MRKATIATRGDWCNGYYWQIVDVDTGAIIHESRSAYDNREWARDDAVDWADKNSDWVDVIDAAFWSGKGRGL